MKKTRLNVPMFVMSLLVLSNSLVFAAEYCIDIPEKYQEVAFSAITSDGQACKTEERNVNGVVIQDAETGDACVARIVKDILVRGVYNYEKKKALDEAVLDVKPIEVSFDKK